MRIFSPHVNSTVPPIVDVYVTLHCDKYSVHIASVGDGCVCQIGTSFEPYPNTTILIVDSVDRVGAIDENGLWIGANAIVVYKSNSIRIPCCIRTKFRLIERHTCNEICAFS